MLTSNMRAVNEGTTAPRTIPATARIIPAGKIHPFTSFTISVFCCVLKISITSDFFTKRHPTILSANINKMVIKIPASIPVIPKRYCICSPEIINVSKIFQMPNETGIEQINPTREDTPTKMQSSFISRLRNVFFSRPKAIRIPYSLALKRKNN